VRPLDGTDAKLWSVLTHAQDGRPGHTGVLVELIFLNIMGWGSVREETKHFYSKANVIIVGYQVSNILMNQSSSCHK